MYLFLKDAKLFLRDSINKLYINKVYLLLKDAHEGIPLQVIHKYSVPPSEGCHSPSEGFHLQVKNQHLLLRDANLLLGDSIAILRCLLPLMLLLSIDSSFLSNRGVDTVSYTFPMPFEVL